MKFVLAIASLLVLSVVYAYPSEIRTFEEFKKAFNKHYVTPEAEQEARQNFLASLEHIEKAGKGRINQFSDMSLEEFKNQYLMSDQAYEALKKEFDLDAGAQACQIGAVNIPNEIDLRALGYVTKIKNQVACGSCWAFSGVATVESNYLSYDNVSLDLSEQELVDCASQHGCGGDTVLNGLRYIQKNGVVEEQSYPYKAREGRCQRPNAKRYGIKDLCQIYPPNGDKIRTYLATKQAALSVIIGIRDLDSFRHYDGRTILQSDNGGKRNFHAINIVGYGSKQGVRYWIIRNSWDTTWGDKGYGYFVADKNLMGIEKFPLAAML
uniref:Peptidase 1 n=2 Tax=Psoroptes ovis TaxID=83912 RepID=PEPT1_PSOOV|nr:RecName: Full=Peptidase 1; AltName: Full=Mite group 1 allergen Pso o 1; AltName: Allergen=Pso o 1; Flags: Precursor [Psoroptes ovis]CAK32515.1 cysteine proteinase allergen [Psoroptes ovis]